MIFGYKQFNIGNRYIESEVSKHAISDKKHFKKAWYKAKM